MKKVQHHARTYGVHTCAIVAIVAITIVGFIFPCVSVAMAAPVPFITLYCVYLTMRMEARMREQEKKNV